MQVSKLTDTIVQTVEHWDGSLLAPSNANKRIEGVQVFRSTFFERYFATAHPIMPGIWWGPIALYCLYATAAAEQFAPMRALLTFVGGFLTWTLIEYLLHRFLFHLVPDDTFDSKLRQFMVHGYHHEFPNDRMRLVAPLILSVPFGLLFSVSYALIFGRYYWLTWFAGTVIGYISYDWTHYYTHHFRPTTRLGKFLRRYHMEHHYRDSESHFGISSPLWDWVFGTARGRSSASGSGREALGESLSESN